MCLRKITLVILIWNVGGILSEVPNNFHQNEDMYFGSGDDGDDEPIYLNYGSGPALIGTSTSETFLTTSSLPTEPTFTESDGKYVVLIQNGRAKVLEKIEELSSQEEPAKTPFSEDFYPANLQNRTENLLPRALQTFQHNFLRYKTEMNLNLLQKILPPLQQIQANLTLLHRLSHNSYQTYANKSQELERELIQVERVFFHGRAILNRSSQLQETIHEQLLKAYEEMVEILENPLGDLMSPKEDGMAMSTALHNNYS